MANAVGILNGYSSWFPANSSRTNHKVRIFSVSVSARSVSDPYKTLRIHPNASKSEVKKAFRKLALQYHPDVCKENNNGIQFQHINEAYDTVMSQLKEESVKQDVKPYESYGVGLEESVIGMDGSDCELWDEWMGWEGAGIRDYSSHINPYI